MFLNTACPIFAHSRVEQPDSDIKTEMPPAKEASPASRAKARFDEVGFSSRPSSFYLI